MFQYVDPGTGSLLTQLVLSAVIGSGFYLIVLRKRIANFFRRSRGAPESPASEKETETSED